MQFFRNTEIQKTLLLYGLLAGAATALAALWDRRFGIFTLVLSLLFLALYLGSTYKRYRHIAALSTEIDRILHSISIRSETKLSYLYV